MKPLTQTHSALEATVLAALGQPAIHRPGVMIYQQDCVEALRLLPPGLVDLTVTSPPYNIGKEYETATDVDQYVAWCQQWIEGIAKVSSPGSAFWLNVGYLPLPGRGKAVPISYLLWDKVPMHLIQEIGRAHV